MQHVSQLWKGKHVDVMQRIRGRFVKRQLAFVVEAGSKPPPPRPQRRYVGGRKNDRSPRPHYPTTLQDEIEGALDVFNSVDTDDGVKSVVCKRQGFVHIPLLKGHAGDFAEVLAIGGDNRPARAKAALRKCSLAGRNVEDVLDRLILQQQVGNNIVRVLACVLGQSGLRRIGRHISDSKAGGIRGKWAELPRLIAVFAIGRQVHKGAATMHMATVRLPLLAIAASFIVE